MKKIFFSFLLISLIFANYLSADTFDVSQMKVTTDNLPENYKEFLVNGYVSTFDVLNNASYLLILKDKNGKFYTYDDDGYYRGYLGATSAVYYFTLNTSTGKYEYKSSYNASKAIVSYEYYNGSPSICDSNVPIYTDSTCSEVFFESISKPDISIGNPDSKLQLTYEYNEDFTECKINATIVDGAFTDKIYYSNYQPGVTGGLLTKKRFPTERNNCY